MSPKQATSDEAFSHVGQWCDLIQVPASTMSPKQVPSAEHFFPIKMQWVQGLTSSEADKYWGMTVCAL